MANIDWGNRKTWSDAFVDDGSGVLTRITDERIASIWALTGHFTDSAGEAAVISTNGALLAHIQNYVSANPLLKEKLEKGSPEEKLWAERTATVAALTLLAGEIGLNDEYITKVVMAYRDNLPNRPTDPVLEEKVRIETLRLIKEEQKATNDTSLKEAQDRLSGTLTGAGVMPYQVRQMVSDAGYPVHKRKVSAALDAAAQVTTKAVNAAILAKGNGEALTEREMQDVINGLRDNEVYKNLEAQTCGRGSFINSLTSMTFSGLVSGLKAAPKALLVGPFLHMLGSTVCNLVGHPELAAFTGVKGMMGAAALAGAGNKFARHNAEVSKKKDALHDSLMAVARKCNADFQEWDEKRAPSNRYVIKDLEAPPLIASLVPPANSSQATPATGTTQTASTPAATGQTTPSSVAQPSQQQAGANTTDPQGVQRALDLISDALATGPGNGFPTTNDIARLVHSMIPLCNDLKREHFDPHALANEAMLRGHDAAKRTDILDVALQVRGLVMASHAASQGQNTNNISPSPGIGSKNSPQVPTVC